MQQPTLRRALRARSFALAVIPLAVLQAHAAQVTATWTNAAGGSYGTASNWTVNHVPLNDATNTYIAQISGAPSVTYGILGANTVDQLLLDANVAFKLSGTSLITPTTLTALDKALIGGTITADNASFSALGAGTNFLGTRNAVSVLNGGRVALAATGFNASGFTGGTILGAQNAGSRIDLASVSSLNSGSPATNFVYTNTVSATDQAAIKLSGVQSVVAPAFTSGTLAFVANGGGSIDLSSLSAVQGVTLDTGNTSFTSDAGSFALGAMQSVNRMFVSLTNGATMTVAGAAGTAQITNSTFGASAGAKLQAAGWKGEYHVQKVTGGTILSAAGAATVLDLSGLTLLDSGAPATNFVYTNTVSATDKAVIKLAGVQTVIAPAFTSGTLAFVANSGASIDLSSLSNVQGVTLDSGNTSFTSDAGSFALGAMQSVNRMFVSLTNAATMNIAGSAATAQITNSTFGASAGAKLLAAGWNAEYHAQKITGGTLMSATNAGTLLDLSGLSLIDSGAPATNFVYGNTVSATDKAAIKLSGVQKVVAPAFTSGTLAFVANGGASIDLSSLNSAGGVTIDTGNTSFSSDNGRIAVGALQSANRVFVSLANGATMTIAGSAAPAQITNSTFAATSGAKLLAAGWKGEYHVQKVTGGTLMSASNAGSLLDLSGLTLLDGSSPATNFVYANVVGASDKAAIKLAGLKTVMAPLFASGSLTFAASGGAAIDLSSLQTVNNAAGGQVNFNASSGGTITLHAFSAGPAVHFNLADAGSTLNMLGGLALLNGSTMAAGTATHLDLRGSFSFQQTVESQVNLDQAVVSFLGSSAATLEVGGAALGLPTLGSVVHNNFALGQLVLGQTGAASVVQLADAIDNGNRHSPEVLYLNGVAGTNGLRLLAGSTLVLDGLDLYTLDNGQWLHVNDLFTGGVTRIAYDQGFITTVPEPASWALWLGGIGILARLRRRRLPYNADA